ncbi:T9SS type A sorting domain-containing protein, partial [Calditrichota bacterium]
IYKMNPMDNDTMFVAMLEPDSSGDPEGCFITNQYDTYGSWVFMNISGSGADDRIDIWQLKPNNEWLSVEPAMGTIDPGANQELTLTLNSAGLDSTLVYPGELIFSQIVGGDQTSIPITLTISSTGVFDENKGYFPSEFGLTSVYPNPFNSLTHIAYSLSAAVEVSLEIYDLHGRLVTRLVEGTQSAGLHRTTWDAWSMTSGLYLVQLTAGERTFTQKVMLIR